VIRALRTLETAGAIVEIGKAHNGRTREFEIVLGLERTRSASPYKNAQRHPTNDAERHPTRRSASFLETLSVTPRSTEEQQEQHGGQHRVSQAPHLPPVDKGHAA
jgi:hypothetical protein